MHDIYFGTYSALVDVNDADNGNYLNEGDQFFGYLGNSAYPNGDPHWNSVDFTANSAGNNITRNVWHYFGQYVPYWLGQTGHVDGNGNLVGNSTNADVNQRLIEDSRGIDGLRADFGQGLPPQCWEYIINVARSYKWNFVFMTESLDGGAVTYRSNRHFDILNENIVFPFQDASTAQNYRDIFDGRRSAYGQSLILMNSTSHDEETYADPFQALIRYMVSGDHRRRADDLLRTGKRHFARPSASTTTSQISASRFRTSNSSTRSARSWATRRCVAATLPRFRGGRPGAAVQPALRSSNRYYLNQTDSSVQQSIFSVAKYDTANASPGVSDVVFGFVNLDRNNTQAGNYQRERLAGRREQPFRHPRGRIYNVKQYRRVPRRGQHAPQHVPDSRQRHRRQPARQWAVRLPQPGAADQRRVGDRSLRGAIPQALRSDAAADRYSARRRQKVMRWATAATFNWSAVSDTLGGVSGYRLIVSTDAAGNNVLFNDLVGNVTSYTIGKLAPAKRSTRGSMRSTTPGSKVR